MQKPHSSLTTLWVEIHQGISPTSVKKYGNDESKFIYSLRQKMVVTLRIVMRLYFLNVIKSGSQIRFLKKSVKNCGNCGNTVVHDLQ